MGPTGVECVLEVEWNWEPTNYNKPTSYITFSLSSVCQFTDYVISGSDWVGWIFNYNRSTGTLRNGAA